MVGLQAQGFGMIRSEKACFKCKSVKPLSEFYAHHAMADGHLNKCKECTKQDSAKHREKNLQKIRAYDRERAKQPARRTQSIQINARWRKADSRRMRAHNAVSRALRKGFLIKQPCVRCGNENSLAHHEDYDFPLQVIWFCQPCHSQRHKEINELLATKDQR